MNKGGAIANFDTLCLKKHMKDRKQIGRPMCLYHVDALNLGTTYQFTKLCRLFMKIQNLAKLYAPFCALYLSTIKSAIK